MQIFSFRRHPAEHDEAELLSSSLARIESGERTLEACLAELPAEAVWLRPLLETALATRAITEPGPSTAVQARLRARVLAATAPRPMPAARRPLWQPAAMAGMAMLLLATLAAPVGALSSGHAVPGDWNYGMKRAGERVRLAVTVDDRGRRQLHLALAKRREGEIEALLQQNRPEYLPGAVRALNQEISTVNISLSHGSKLSQSEAVNLALVSLRQEAVLEQVQQTVVDAPEPVRASVQDAVTPARSAVQETKETAIRAVERTDPQLAAQLAQQPAAISPPSAATIRTPATAAPSPSMTPVPSAAPAPSPGATAAPSATPSASPSPAGSASPSPSASAAPIPSAPASSPPSAAPSNSAAHATPATAPATPIAAPSTIIAPPATVGPVSAAPPVSIAQTPVPAPVIAPPTPAPVLAPTPVPTPRSAESTTVPNTTRPTATPSPAPLRTPAPLAVQPTATPTPAHTTGGVLTLLPGSSVFEYNGPAQSLATLLAPVAGRYRTVDVIAPNGYRIGFPGGAGISGYPIQPGSTVIIDMTEPGAILLP